MHAAMGRRHSARRSAGTAVHTTASEQFANGATSMRRLILQEFVSIDGRASGPEGSVDFIPAHHLENDDVFSREQLSLMESVDTMLLGRVTSGCSRAPGLT